MRAHTTGRVIAVAGVAALGVAAGLALSRTRKTALQAVMALTGDWDRQLKAEHAAVKRLLKAMVESEPLEAVKRSALVESVDEALTRHALEEEKVIYPALKGAGAGLAVDGLYADHAQMKTLVRELQEMSAEDPAWLDQAKVLRRLVQQHVKREEELFPLLHELSDRQRNKTLTGLVRKEATRVS
jgi:hemerythrin superfamily protein